MDASHELEDELLDFGFNQDATCFACSTNSGFRIFSCEPYRQQFRRDFDKGGIGVVQMLFRCNIFAIVGGGTTPRFPPTNVMIWDDDQQKCIAELSFRSQVRSVRLRRDRIVVCQEAKVSVYNFADLHLLHSIETGPNSRGLVALSSHPDATVLACPGLQSGKVRVELYDRAATRFIDAHDSALSCLELSLDGRILATASEKGTLIRVWNTSTTNILQEVRRGLDTAVIFSIAISRSCDFLAVSSDKGTVHVFPLRCFTSSGDQSEEEEDSNNHSAISQTMNSMLSYVKGIVPLPSYFYSEWSLAQFRIPEDCWSVVAFGAKPNSLYVLNQKGSFYKVEFDPIKGGPCTQKQYHNFLEMD